MKKTFISITFLLLIQLSIVAQTAVGTIVFSDDFEGVNLSGGSPPTSYSLLKQTISGDTPEDAKYYSGKMRVTAPKTSVTRNGVFGNLSVYASPFAPKLSEIDADSVVWTFNMRANRNYVSGFDEGSFGIATVLLSDAIDYSSANGYAVICRGTSGTRSFRLAKFTNGLDADAKFVDIIDGLPGDANIYPSIRVTYIKNSNTWKFYGRSDGTAFANPAQGEMTFLGSAVDDTYVNTSMSFFGFFINCKSFTGNTNLDIDNFTVQTFQNTDKRITPTDDTYIYGNGGVNVMRGMEDLFCSYYSSSPLYQRVSYLKFDLTYLSPFLETAKLRLFTNGFPAGGDLDHIFDLYPVQLNTWSEDDITYDNFQERLGPEINSPILASYIVPAGNSLSPQFIEFSGENLTKYLADSLSAGRKYISFRLQERNSVKNGTAGVIVEFHSKENQSTFVPELLVKEKNMESLKASDIQVNGVTIDNFSETTYRYVYKFKPDMIEIPVVNATSKYDDVTLDIVQVSSLTGSEEERTAKVIVSKDEDVLTYSIIFEMLPPPNDARLADILVNNNSIEFFNKEKTDYIVYLPYTEELVPEVSVVVNEPSATTNVVNAISINPVDPTVNRTTVINVTSGDGIHMKTYNIEFHRLPELDMVLAIGQSNMAGRAPFDDYTTPMDNVYLLTPAGGMEIALNPLNKYSNIRKDIGIQRLGPSYACALNVQKHTGKPIAFIVNAQGGSALSTWYQPGKSNYDATIKRAKEAQRFGKFRAIIWHQGEGDSRYPENYLTRLKVMVESLRNDLNEPDLYFVAGEIAYWRGGGTGSTEFNDSIRTISSRIPNSDWISAEGCTPLINESDPHFDAPSAILLGERYAEKLIENVFKTSSVDKISQIDSPLVLNKNQGLTILNKEKSLFYYLTDLLGNVMHRGNLRAYQSIDIKIRQGIYLLSFVQHDQSVTHKIFIH